MFRLLKILIVKKTFHKNIRIIYFNFDFDLFTRKTVNELIIGTLKLVGIPL